VVTPEEVRRWTAVLERLRRGPAPRGDQFEMCREVLASAPGTPESVEAARILLEGAMADATTSIADAQDVMRALRAIGRGELEVARLLSPR
jgi:hypothetical protein